MFGGLRKRREEKERRSDALLLQQVFQEGYDARGAGQPCTPPPEYGPDTGHDLSAEWVAGWVEADRASPS
jgi:hypothetical protein